MPQTKTQAGGKKARLLWYFLRGSKRFYLAAVLCSVCITFLDMLTPQLIRITIDNVLGQLPLNVPAFLEPAWLRLGGVGAQRGRHVRARDGVRARGRGRARAAHRVRGARAHHVAH